ncbi:MAG TPA: FtsX-like permease family protein [Rhodocyclaceae bacterium]|nr:FtsX-like permease family protein [Rhodocyclaceae bacterium]
MLNDAVQRAGRTTQVAARNLFRQQRRAALAMLIICGGVVTFLLAGGFIHWLLDNMRESTIHSQLGHVQITRPDYFRKGLGDPYSYLLPPGTEAVDAQPPKGMVTITPRLAFNGLLSSGDSTISFMGEGIDPARESLVGRSIRIVDGQGLDPAGGEGVIIGRGLAANLGVRPGDTVVLLATTAEGGLNAVELPVTGLFATTVKAYDDAALRVPIDTARKLMRVEGATSWIVLLERTADTDNALTALRARLPASEFEAIPWYELADFYNKTAELFTRQVGVVRILIALIVVLSISNTLSMTVVERTGEIGTAMALGVRRAGILRMFLTEGALLGIIGGALGVGLGLVLASAISAVGIPMPPPPGMETGFTGRISVPPALAWEAFQLAFVTTLLASIVPAWKASRMNIVDALRHQR